MTRVRLRTRFAVLTALAGLLAFALPAPGAAANAGARSHHVKPKPTVVLVHGAWADGSSWNAVAQRLIQDGYPVRMPPNPLRNLSTDAQTVSDFLSTVTGPVILVGHSYGGAVITNAANGHANVKALVYVDAFAPAAGESIFPLAGAGSVVLGDPATVFDTAAYPGAPPGDVDLYLKHDLFVTSFANGVPRSQAELLWAAQRPIAYSAGTVPSGVPAYLTIRSWYVLGTQDKVITPDAQRMMAERAGARITEVRAGHLSMITRPDVVTGVIEQAVRATA
ncbi:alpha/beta fold hydrolase [Hamadaea tsunoensis]|uniref:alpha/beta fold hydrolase n=1 Tax=Hamadaea tsunoensis TaxID=53368 RepID=UPI0004019102|nr:alpha/beta hydrolase [Hamadaea tsunoensis]